MDEPGDREAAIRAAAAKHVVVTLPGMDTLPVRRDVTFRSAAGRALLLDVYYPPASTGRRPPAVLLPIAYADPVSRARAFDPLTSWARLIAASGIAAVVCGAEAPADDAPAALGHLRTDAAALDIDGDRLGLFATSANAVVALSTLMRDRRARTAALLCGYTMDLPGSTAVADAARQFGFVDACEGRSADDLPPDVPLLFVRAGRDACPGLNDSLDAVVSRAVARNLPAWLINHATGAHGFDLDERTPLARGIVREVLAFLQLHLGR
ncbi:MAG: alpha/beta hydrolase family protein [Vicinamibacterales bacterium]